MAAKETVTVAGGASALSFFAGFNLDPDKGLMVLQWLSKEIGTVGFVLALGLGAALAIAVTTNWLFWNRMKEMTGECQAENNRQRDAWKAVVDGKDADNKEMATLLRDLLVQVTRLAERAGIGTAQTRSR